MDATAELSDSMTVMTLVYENYFYMILVILFTPLFLEKYCHTVILS